MLHDMSYLPRQMRRRIESWTEELRRHFYVPICPLEWEGFLTYEQLSKDTAMSGSFSSFPEGRKWGAKGEYGWFRSSFVIPEEYWGKVTCSPIGVGGEALVYFDGSAVGSIDRHHKLVYLSYNGQKGKHTLFVEAYAGSGVLLEGGGPIPPTRRVYPPVGSTQQRIEGASVGYIEEDVYQLYHDVFTLTNLLEVLEPTSLQAESIVGALTQFTRIVDFEKDHKAMVASCTEARSLLAPLLSWKNGSCAPRFSVFGQSHIDLAWKWTVEETKRKCGRTYANQISLLKQYPEYRFLLCEPALLEMIRTYHPSLFAEVSELLSDGRLIAEGAFYVECDTNLPSAESLVKQLVYGQRWFKKETGSPSTFAWLPDTFGFSASLPQILRQAGVTSFGTQKLLRADPESDPFPFTDFWWEGEDGTRILSNMCYRNNCEITPKELYKRWHVNRNQHENIDGMIYPFGYGDGGGGPDRDLVEQMVRLKDLQGIPRITIEGPKEYFDRINNKTLNVHSGELYLAWHRGTYSSQQRIKQLNAQCEQALEAYSFWATMLEDSDETQLKRWWKCVMFNQFHDILAGVSIKDVNRQAERELMQVAEESQKALQALLAGCMEEKSGRYTLYNHTLHQLQVWVQFPVHGVVYQGSKEVPIYQGETGACALLFLPPSSPTVVKVAPPQSKKSAESSLVHERPDGLFCSNGTMSFLLDRRGVLRDVTYQGRIICRSANDLVLYQDINPDYDAWEIGKESLSMQVDTAVLDALEILTDTPNMARILLRMHIGCSKIEQTVSFDGVANEIRFSLDVDWHERHKMLKSVSEHCFVSDSYVCDTQLGYKRLPLQGNTTADRDRYEVCAQRYLALYDEAHTLLLMNSYPFGVSARDKQVGMTLLRSPLIPDERAEEGRHALHYGLTVLPEPHSGLHCKKRANQMGIQIPVLPGAWNHPPFFELLEGEAVMTTVERGEQGTVVLRISNPGRRTEQIRLVTTLLCSEVWECTLLEEKQEPVRQESDAYVVVLPPFSLRTLVFSIKKAKNARI
nr:glycoside hydrolase family 38 C-terminal domain-containing protein [uncultured Sphaerochaeta sp.]